MYKHFCSDISIDTSRRIHLLHVPRYYDLAATAAVCIVPRYGIIRDINITPWVCRLPYTERDIASVYTGRSYQRPIDCDHSECMKIESFAYYSSDVCDFQG